MRTAILRSAYFVSIESSAATVDASQICARRRSIVTAAGSSAYQNWSTRSLLLPKNSGPVTV